MNVFKKMLLAVCFFCMVALPSRAWNRNEHALIAWTAAMLLAQGKDAGFLKEHAFDVGYYSNVPDLIWKRPATYDRELYQHFMDWEIFERNIPADELRKAFNLRAREFDAKFPKIKKMAGRSFWRIRDLEKNLSGVTVLLRGEKLTRNERHNLQARWIFLAGVLAHYSGDLAQPLHVTENYDGQLTGQKGAHEFIEGTLADYFEPGLSRDVTRLARKRWHKYHKDMSGKALTDLLWETAGDSRRELTKFLERDRLMPRTDLKRAAMANQDMLVERIVAGALLTAEIWSRHLGWRFDGEKFYGFIERPAYVYPED